ncbi:type I polyketide synthase [Actinokineospora sp. 24-640]
MPRSDQVAIVGAACRLPGGIDSVGELWSALAAGCDLVSEAPVDRFDGARLVDPVRDRKGKIASSAGGYLDDVTGFDAEFFGLSPTEASRIDPQQRIAMELAIEALDDAGIDPASLSGSRTAVVMGASSFDYLALQHNDLASINAYTNVGGSLCNVSGRVSHVLDLRGPCFTVDTACSSSLTALHQACAALLAGDARLALAGGVNAILNPGWSVGFAQARMTSPTGRCHAFSEEADGYVRAEGGGVVVLKLLADALADGDRVHAVVAGTAVNFDGRTPGMSQPRADTQEALLRGIYPSCGVDAGDVAYVEAHGTGTLVGDAVECAALGAVLGRDRPADAPLPIGSVKTNVGHLEAAAGMAGLLKALLVLRHRKIPPSLHAEPLSTRIDFAGLGLAPVTATRALPEGRRAAVGVNAFGFGGANAHAVLVDAPPAAARTTPARSAPARSTPPVVVSARTPEAAAQAARAMSARLAGATDDEVHDIAYTACRRRPAHRYRVAAAAADRETLARRLSEVADGPVAGAAADSARARPGVVFVFSGNGSQWTGMGADLMRQDPVFSAAVRELDDALSPHLGWSVADALSDGTADPARSTVAVPALFAVQVGLVAALGARGVTPSAVIGHSVGELAAAHVSGALDLDTACLLVASRARCVEPAAGTGAMAAVGVGPRRARELLAEYGGAVDLAAVNSPTDVTLSGDREALAELGARLSASGTFFRLLDVDYPYHHHALEPCGARLREELAEMATAPGTVPMVSTVTGEPVRGDELGPEYWYRNLMRPVLFARALAAAGHDIFLEVGPHPVLRPYLRLPGTTSLETVARGKCGVTALDGAVAGIVAAGGELEWGKPFPEAGRVVDLPPYPWRRERQWNGDLTTWTPPEVHPLLGARQSAVEPSWVGSLDPTRVPWLGEHVICGATVLPGSAIVDMALAAGRDAFDQPVQVDDLDLLRFIGIGAPEDIALRVQVSLDRDDGRVRVASRGDDGQPWHLNARCRVRRLHAEPPPDVALTRWWSETATGIDGAAHYEQGAAAGYGWGPTFQVLQGIQVDGDRLCARYRFTGPQEGYEVHPALLDGVLQSAVPLRQGFADRTALPSFIARTRLWEQPAEEGFALVHCRPA